MTKNEIKFIRSLASKKERDAAGLFVAEGEKLVSELAQTIRVDQIFRVGHNCSASEMERISLLKSPSSTLGLFEIPQVGPSVWCGGGGRAIVLDSVQDPGNMGTIIRTADWFGVKRIVCSMDTADLYAPKVVQATMGAIARVEVLYTELPEWLAAQSDTTIYGTFLEDSRPLAEVDFASDAIIVMGNEGRGISSAVERFVTERVRIERGEGGGGESLNVAVATAIILSRL